MTFLTPRMRLTTKLAAAVICTAAIVCTVPSCETLQPAQVDAAQVDALDALAASETVLKDPDATAVQKAEAQTIRKTILDLQAELAEVRKGYDADSKGPHTAEDTLTTLGGIVPPPWGMIVTTLVPLVGWGIREKKWMGRFTQVIGAIQTAKKRSDALASALSASKDAIHANMDVATIALVEKTMATTDATASGGVPVKV